MVWLADQEPKPVRVPNLSPEAIMFNLGQLEDRLNRDPAFRRQFLDSPVDVLRKEGLLLSPTQESALRER
jgi:hypothetical protein